MEEDIHRQFPGRVFIVQESSTMGRYAQAVMDQSSLICVAREARKNAHATYSGFAVGAALLSEDGSVFTGCNVENLSFGLTMCAERVAVGSAVAAGHRKFQCLAIVADTEEVLGPCGACRQVLAEFRPDLKIFAANLRGRVEEFSLDVLLPRASKGILNKPG